MWTRTSVGLMHFCVVRNADHTLPYHKLFLKSTQSYKVTAATPGTRSSGLKGEVVGLFSHFCGPGVSRAAIRLGRPAPR